MRQIINKNCDVKITNEVTIADINNDLKKDLIFASGLMNEGVQIYTQNTSGIFSANQLNSLSSIYGIAAGDLNNDSLN